MSRTLRRGAAAFVSLGVALLFGGCVQTSLITTSHQPNPAQPSHPEFSLDTPVETIVADPCGKAALDRDLPGLITDSHYMLIEEMSLNQIAMISGGRLTRSMLDQVQADFDRLAAADP